MSGLPQRTKVWLWLVGIVLVVLFLLMCANVLYGPASEPRSSSSL